MSVISCAAGDQFAAQTRILIDFEHVNAHVRTLRWQDLSTENLPALGSLVRQSRNQIDIDVRNSRRAQPGDSRARFFRLCNRPTAAAS